MWIVFCLFSHISRISFAEWVPNGIHLGSTDSFLNTLALGSAFRLQALIGIHLGSPGSLVIEFELDSSIGLRVRKRIQLGSTRFVLGSQQCSQGICTGFCTLAMGSKQDSLGLYRQLPCGISDLHLGLQTGFTNLLAPWFPCSPLAPGVSGRLGAGRPPSLGEGLRV